MKTKPFSFLILGTAFAGISLCISTAQDLPAPDPSTVSDNPAIPPSEDTPLLSAASPPSGTAESESDAATPPGVEGAAPDSAPETVTSAERISMILIKIRDNDRAVDPFGLQMDPSGRQGGSILADQYEEIVEEREVSATSLASALTQLSLTGAYPTDQKVVVGPRSFKMGEMFGMQFGDLTLRIRFEGIKGHKVYFRDMDTKELAFLDFNTTPQEFEPMFKNSRLSTPDGINAMNDIFIVN